MTFFHVKGHLKNKYLVWIKYLKKFFGKLKKEHI